jgi:hypothetical protein
MNYPYQALFLDIRLAKERLEAALDSARGVAPEPRLAEAQLSERVHAGRKQELTRSISCAEAIQLLAPYRR